MELVFHMFPYISVLWILLTMYKYYILLYTRNTGPYILQFHGVKFSFYYSKQPPWWRTPDKTHWLEALFYEFPTENDFSYSSIHSFSCHNEVM